MPKTRAGEVEDAGSRADAPNGNVDGEDTSKTISAGDGDGTGVKSDADVT